jgi:hypothetical protein
MTPTVPLRTPRRRWLRGHDLVAGLVRATVHVEDGARQEAGLDVLAGVLRSSTSNQRAATMSVLDQR